MMPKRCIRCGFIADDRATICGRCGAPMTAVTAAPVQQPQAGNYRQPPGPPQNYQQQNYPQQSYPRQRQPYQSYGYSGGGYPPMPKKKKLPALGICLASVAVLLAVFILLNVLNVFDPLNLFGPEASAQGITEQLLQACFIDYNSDRMLDTMYEMNAVPENDSRVQEARTTMSEQMLQMKGALYAYNATISYEIIGTYPVDEGTYAARINELRQEGIPIGQITEMAEVSFTLTATSASVDQGAQSETLPSATVLCIKANNRWYVSASSISAVFELMESF